jgi:hypothetical protein
MFKKTLMFGLALLLVLSLGAQAGVVLAKEITVEPGTSVPPHVPVLIQSVTLLNGFPPRIRVTGVLPAGCYHLKVGTPQVGKPLMDAYLTPITIQVRGVWGRGTVCSSAPQRFATTVTIDPIQLNLAAGRYVVRISPGWGQRPHLILITIPHGLD